ncbi:MAG: hypothetical protein J4N26_01910 [Chloroflexi bacterium]|nr:hypothetical protein [Chloroflexota bacterium]
MGLTNRVIIIGAALIWIFVILVVILLAWGAPDNSIDQLSDLANYLADHNDRATKMIITFGGLILLLLGVLTIIIEVAPPETGSLPVADVGSGQGSISTEEVVVRVEDGVRALAQVSDVQATVLGRGKKADVTLKLHVRPEADLAATTDEACRVTRELIEEKMGLELARPPQAELHYRVLNVSRTRQSKATTIQSPPPASVQQTEAAPAVSPPSTASPPSTVSPPSTASPPSTVSPPSTQEPMHEATEEPSEDRPSGA